jgi:hypothetical protein
VVSVRRRFGTYSTKHRDDDDDDDDDDDKYSDEWMTKTTDTKTRRQKAAKTHILHPSPG